MKIAMGKLRILCLHGSRQDGEIFSQRISKLRAKLSDIAVRKLNAPACPCDCLQCSAV